MNWDKHTIEIYERYFEQEKRTDPMIRHYEDQITAINRRRLPHRIKRALIWIFAVLLEKLIEKAAQRARVRLDEDLKLLD